MHSDSIRRAFTLVGIVTVAWLSLTILIGGWWQFRTALAKTDAAEHWASITRNIAFAASQIAVPDQPAAASPIRHAQGKLASLAPFVGTWGRHGMRLVVAPDGSADASWRTYFSCSDPGVTPPCDGIDDVGFVYGGRSRMVFTSADGDTAYGTMLETNAPTAMLTPPYPVLLVRQPNGTLLLLSGEATMIPPDQRRPTDGTILCGSLAAWQTGVCGA